MVSKYQNFQIQTINRKDIKNAPYNPRIMDKEAKKRLKDGLRKHGLVSTLTWNKRTGNLVGGHQRLEQLDSLEKNKDYEISVCVIDVDEKEEVMLNTILNNPSMQGDWDLDKLAELAEEFDLSVSDLGFSELDAELMFDGDERFTSLFETEEVVKAKDGLEKIKEARKKGNERMAEKNNINWYAMIVFANEKERAEFFRKINTPVSEEFLSVEKIMRIAEHNND